MGTGEFNAGGNGYAGTHLYTWVPANLMLGVTVTPSIKFAGTHIQGEYKYS